MARFKLTGPYEGKTIVLGNNQYSFVNGIMECSDNDAHLIAHILRENYQAIRMADDEPVQVKKVEPAKPTVAGK